ncbi:MAG: hypothetical protein AMXMBFR58_01400 [Phycisphaerae bacterium]
MYRGSDITLSSGIAMNTTLIEPPITVKTPSCEKNIIRSPWEECHATMLKHTRPITVPIAEDLSTVFPGLGGAASATGARAPGSVEWCIGHATGAGPPSRRSRRLQGAPETDRPARPAQSL